jgi:hypothetical protein
MFDRALYDWMEMEYSLLEEGLTKAGQACPACKGPACLSVSRVNKQLLWFCHRASCGFRRGKAYDGITLYDKAPTPDREVNAPKTYPLQEWMYSLLEENYGIGKVSANRAGIMYAEPAHARDGMRLFMPVRDLAGENVGYSLRAINKLVFPKTILKTVRQNQLAWYPNRTVTKNILVVEDQLSAIRAAEHITTVALLGTNLSDDRMEALCLADAGTIHLALDKDAFAKAVRFVVKYRAKSKGRLRMIQLDQDIKNQPLNKFLETIYNVSQ